MLDYEMITQASDLKASYSPEEIDAFNELAWRLRVSQKQRSYAISQKANECSRSGMFSGQPYRKGLAASLINLAWINSDWGKLDLAISQCFEGLSMINDQPPSPVVVDAWSTICWIHVYLGDYGTALDYGLRAVRLARELEAGSREGWALDALASTYSVSGDHSDALQAHREALQVFQALDDRIGETHVLNNLSMALLDMGAYEDGLAAATKSLELAQQQSMRYEEVVACTSVGELLLAMGNIDGAESYFQRANEKQDPETLHMRVYILTDLTRACMARNDMENARRYLEQALEIAVETDLRGNQAECYRLLSEVCERQGKYAEALEFHKQFHTMKEKVTGEGAASRLAVIKVTHQVETAQRNAEIYRLRNVGLQYEVQERKRAESVLENLAAHDSLTGLNNRRKFFQLAIDEIAYADQYCHPLTLLMIDIDHFKQVNDRYGHLVGDIVLMNVASIIRESLREKDIIGRFGGEEFAVILPNTVLSDGWMVCERIRINLANHVFVQEGTSFTVTASIGAAELGGWDDSADKCMDILLSRADKALYAAKEAGRNRTSKYAGENFPESH